MHVNTSLALRIFANVAHDGQLRPNCSRWYEVTLNRRIGRRRQITDADFTLSSPLDELCLWSERDRKWGAACVN
jgi:hypothetical protein